jgi:glycosyltransferase involved in cell wall biosynthesis
MIKSLISILIPTYNEELFIKKCLNSVLSFRIPDGKSIEIFVIDGQSNDSTLEIVSKYAKEYSNIYVINNPKKIQAVALNMGIKACNGSWVLRLDAHSEYPVDYLSRCWTSKQNTGADNVGGLFVTKPGAPTYWAKLVQAITTHPFGVGNAGFRIGMQEGYADTVPYGFYHKSIFQKLGYLDERLVRAQDYEFNRRIIWSGGKIWRDPNILVNYFNQPTLRKFLAKQFIYEAPYNVYMWYLAPYAFAPRHAITGFFAIGVIGGLLLSPFSDKIRNVFLVIMAIYFILAIISAFQQSKKYSQIQHLAYLPIGFFLYHIVHGLGMLKGAVLLLMRRAPIQKQKEPWLGYGKFRIKVGRNLK